MGQTQRTRWRWQNLPPHSPQYQLTCEPALPVRAVFPFPFRILRHPQKGRIHGPLIRSGQVGNQRYHTI